MLFDRQPKSVTNPNRLRTKTSLISLSKNTAANGRALIQIKIPALPATKGRILQSVEAWFENPEIGDRVVNIRAIDIDNVLSQGANFVKFSLVDPQVPQDDRGFRIPMHRKFFYLPEVFGSGKMNIDIYLEIIGLKATAAAGQRFWANIEWGIPR